MGSTNAATRRLRAGTTAHTSHPPDARIRREVGGAGSTRPMSLVGAGPGKGLTVTTFNQESSPSGAGVGDKKTPHLQQWGAAYVMIFLFLASWAGQFIAQLIEVGNDARAHGQTFSMSEFWPHFLQSTFENWQSEWLQLAFQAVVLLGMKHVMFKADAADTEELQLDLVEIREHLGIPPRTEHEAQERQRIRQIRANEVPAS